MIVLICPTWQGRQHATNQHDGQFAYGEYACAHISAVIPGHREAMGPESITTGPSLLLGQLALRRITSACWAGERVCPHCDEVDNSSALNRAGVYRCKAKECCKDFTVTTKGVMESSHIKRHIWLQAFYLMAASKKGMSAHCTARLP